MPSPIHVEIDGVGQVQKLTIDFGDAGREVKDRAADVMQKSGPTFVRTMKQVVRKDTRTLEKSLHFTVNRRLVRLRLGSLKRTKNPKTGQFAQDYAGYVHSGTSRMSPNPYTDIALEKHTTPQSGFMRGLYRAGVGNIEKPTGGGRI